MKNKTYRFAAALAILLALALVFVAPVGAEIPKAGTWDLSADTEVTSVITLSGNLVINLNGYTITNSVADGWMIDVAGYSLTIVGDDGSIKIPESNTASYGVIKVSGKDCQLSISDVSISGNTVSHQIDGSDADGIISVIDNEDWTTCSENHPELTLTDVFVDTNRFGVRTLTGIDSISVSGGSYRSKMPSFLIGACSNEDGTRKGTFNGVSISNYDTDRPCIEVASYLVTEITDCEFTIESTVVESTGKAPAAAVSVSYAGKAILTGTTYTLGETLLENPAALYVYPTGGEIVVNEGTTIKSSGVALMAHGDASNAYENSVITVNGGTIEGTLKIKDENGKSYTPKIIIKGGTFIVKDEAGLKAVLDNIAEDAEGVTIQIAKDITITENIEINKPVTITGGDDANNKPTLTSNTRNMLFVSASTTFKNLKMETKQNIGLSLINVRGEGINVNIDGCELKTSKTETVVGGTNVQNQQPLTIGAGKDSVITLSGTIINAGDSGYGIFLGVPTKTLDIKENSDITGYSAIYTHHPVTITVKESTLTGSNIYESANGWNNFGVIAIQSMDVFVTLENADVAYAKSESTAEEAIILFVKKLSDGTSVDCSGSTVTVNSGVKLETNGENAVFEINAADTEFIVINAGVKSTFPIDSAYLAEIDDGKLACVATQTKDGVVTEYTVQAVSEETVAPETPDVGVTEGTTTDVTTGETVSATIITPTAGSETTITTTENDNEVVLKPTTESQVSIIISGVDTTSATEGSMSSVAIPETAEITAVFDTSEGNSEGVTVQLSIKIDNVTKALPVIDTKIDETVEDVIPVPVKKILGMLTALGDTTAVNANIKDDKAVILTFSIPEGIDLNKVKAYHVKDGQDPKEMGWEIVTIEGTDFIRVYGTERFSSYVLVEEEPQQYTGGSATDTGSGNYQYYPRSVPTDGIVDFGTSKVVTGMELPAGSDGTVTLNIKPTFAMPENGFYAFEIDAPGYNTDAKINGGLSFQIPVADLEAAGWTAEDIVLFHGTVGEDGKIVWEALPTNLVKNENGVAYYKAAIAGCSPFYIGFVKDGSVVNTEVVDPTTPETPVTPDEPEVLPPVDEPETPEQPTESPAPILAVLAGLGAAVVLRRK